MLICLVLPIYMFSKSLFEIVTKLNARNIIFNQRPIVVNKITTNSGTDYEKYYHQHNIHIARTTFITIFISS